MSVTPLLFACMTTPVAAGSLEDAREPQDGKNNNDETNEVYYITHDVTFLYVS